jgi:hypothetical protein
VSPLACRFSAMPWPMRPLAPMKPIVDMGSPTNVGGHAAGRGARRSPRSRPIRRPRESAARSAAAVFSLDLRGVATAGDGRTSRPRSSRIQRSANCAAKRLPRRHERPQRVDARPGRDRSRARRRFRPCRTPRPRG